MTQSKPEGAAGPGRDGLLSSQYVYSTTRCYCTRPSSGLKLVAVLSEPVPVLGSDTDPKLLTRTLRVSAQLVDPVALPLHRIQRKTKTDTS